MKSLKRSESVGMTIVEEKAWWEKSDEKVSLRIKNMNHKVSANCSPEREMTP